jgi:hypothetical protein
MAHTVHRVKTRATRTRFPLILLQC